MTETSILTPQSTAPAQHRGLWPIRIVTSVLVLIVLAACSASVIALFFVRESAETTVFSESVHEVQVSTDTGDIVIRAAAAGESTIVVSKSRNAFRKAEHSAAVKDGVLMVSGACRGNFIIADTCSMGFEIVVPAGSAVQANSDTGNLSIAGPSSSVLASTDTGDIRVFNVNGSIRLRTDTGSVTGDQLRSDTASAQTDTGSVTLGFSAAPRQLTAVADTGSVQIRVPDDGSVYRVQASTDTGERFVNVPTAPGADRSIDAETSTGDVKILTVRMP